MSKMLYGEDTFESPNDVYEFVETLIGDLRQSGYDPAPLEFVQQSAYTTSSEWLGELGTAVRRIQAQNIREETLRSGLERIMNLVNRVYPKL